MIPFLTKDPFKAVMIPAAQVEDDEAISFEQALDAPLKKAGRISGDVRVVTRANRPCT